MWCYAYHEIYVDMKNVQPRNKWEIQAQSEHCEKFAGRNVIYPRTIDNFQLVNTYVFVNDTAFT